MHSDDHYWDLLKIFVRIVEANKGTPTGEDDRILDAEGLALKFFGHASSALYLYQGTVLPDVGIDFIDSASINVLGRAALETFLVFHYLFVAPKAETERDFRYMSWRLAGLIERQTFPVQSPKGKEMLGKESELMGPLREELKNNDHFRILSQSQQKDLLLKGKWRQSHWKDIALSAGLSHTHAKAFYHYLCGYAHAGNLSVLQIRKADTPQTQKSLCAATVGVLKISTANMIQAFCKIFRKSQAVLDQDTDGTALVDMWISIGATPTEDIEIDWKREGLSI